MAVYGYRFGTTWCEIHTQMQGGVHVASLFRTWLERPDLEPLGEVSGRSEAEVLRASRRHLARDFGPEVEQFVPLDPEGRTVLPPV